MGERSRFVLPVCVGIKRECSRCEASVWETMALPEIFVNNYYLKKHCCKTA